MTAPTSGPAFWVLPVALLLVSFWVTSALTRPGKNPTADLEGEDDPPAAAPRPAQRPPQQDPRRVSAERLARALAAIKEASSRDAGTPVTSPLPIPEDLGELQKMTVDGPREERAAASELRNQVRFALERTLLPCWRAAPTLKLTANIHATVRRVGHDFEIVNASVQDLSADPFGPAEIECVEQRLAKRRLVNGQAAVWSLPADFESAESFHIRLRKRPKPTKAAPADPDTPVP